MTVIIGARVIVSFDPEEAKRIPVTKHMLAALAYFDGRRMGRIAYGARHPDMPDDELFSKLSRAGLIGWGQLGASDRSGWVPSERGDELLLERSRADK